MDMQALKRDVTEILDLLPPELVLGAVQALAPIIVHGLPRVKAVWPRVRELGQPHVQAMMLEYTAQILEMDELKAVGKEVFTAYLAKFARPAEPPVILAGG